MGPPMGAKGVWVGGHDSVIARIARRGLMYQLQTSTYWLNNSISYDYSIMKQDTLKGLIIM